jgi:hypothetical protein
MIVFELVCTHEHRFEGWFASTEDFDRQCQRGLLSCPVCADPKIEKLPSARIGGFAAATSAADMPNARMRLSELRNAIIAHTEDVGPRFTEEARRMHYDETPKRAIRGVATTTETQELIEEGIDVFPLPISRREDLN